MANYSEIKNWCIPVKDFDNGLIIIEKKMYEKTMKAFVKCPHCGKTRWVTYQGKNQHTTSLCQKCSQREYTLFYIDKDLDCAYFYVPNKGELIKVLIDYDDADRLFGCSFGISGKEKYVIITNGLDKRIRLTDFIMNHRFDDKKYVPDHKNHNIYDNRKQNLVIVPQTLNQGNKKKQRNNTTGFRGIHWDNKLNMWVVQVRFKNKHIAKKRFKLFIDAYNYWYAEYHSYYKESSYNILKDETINLKYAGIKHFDVENGVGLGYTLFVQGCNNHCAGCHNPQTWNFDGGEKYTQEDFNEMINFFKKFPQVKRFTLCGGEPLQNLQLSNYVAAEFKRIFPNRQLWIYTGLKYEDVKDDIKYKPILELCDFLIDGEYVEEQRDLTLKWRGSRNQRVINVQESLKQNKVVLYKD